MIWILNIKESRFWFPCCLKKTHGSSEHDQSFYVGFRTKGKRPLKWILFSRPMFPQPRGMLLDQGIFGDVSQGYADALGEAFEHFALWRRAHKIQSSQKRFTPGQILRDGYGFFLNAKGFRLVWLLSGFLTSSSLFQLVIPVMDWWKLLWSLNKTPNG